MLTPGGARRYDLPVQTKLQKEKNMKKRIICLILTLVLVFGCVALFASCKDNNNDNHEHVDKNNDGICDICGKEIDGGVIIDPDHTHTDKNNDGLCDKCGKVVGAEKPWDQTELIFAVSMNSNFSELSSTAARYLAGGTDYSGKDASSWTSSLDESVRARNAAAKKVTKTTVKYDYTTFPEGNTASWGQSIDTINQKVNSGAPNSPDMYCNFVYDMVGASLIGSFANLLDTSRPNGNYMSFLNFNFDPSVVDKDYMYEYMRSLTLSRHKMYCVASDYFTDLVRAFFVVPVNVSALESITDASVATTLKDLYAKVENYEWTYDELIKYANAFATTGTAGTEVDFEQNKYAFAVSSQSGLSASGLLYTTSITIINREWSSETADYSYWYPTADEIQGLYDFCDKLATLFRTNGVVSVDNKAGAAYLGSGEAGASMLAIRQAFSKGNILFGGVIAVGSLEDSVYQGMKDSKGFGVLPVPLYTNFHESITYQSATNSDGSHKYTYTGKYDLDSATGEYVEVEPDSNGEYHGHYDRDRYLTQIHNIGRLGAISNTTKKFAQCTAFLDYQSTHSAAILNEYYNDQLCYSAAGGDTGTVNMLKYIRSNVRSAFDKAYEDAIGKFFSNTGDGNSDNNKWHSIIMGAPATNGGAPRHDPYIETGMRAEYESLYAGKAKYLKDIENQFNNLP